METSTSSKQLYKACSVCNDVQGTPHRDIDSLCKSVEVTKCPGCIFLSSLINVVYRAMHGESPRSGCSVMINSNLAGPRHLLAIPYYHSLFMAQGVVEVYKDPGMYCPWATIEEATAISGNTGSEAALDRASAWLENCQSDHKLCLKNLKAPLPTRVLDLGPPGINPKIRLLETAGALGRYACLSHRWIEGDTITTTLSNIDERKKLIPWDTLPKVFQHSITVARRLGLRYMWISSLCIIQGSESKDWMTEAQKMATYYQNGYITLSASCAINAGDGCFQNTPTSTSMVFLASKSFLEYKVSYRRPLSHQPLPLHLRGWVYQEHILSPRVLHFGQELIWECLEATLCECSRIEQDIPDIIPGIPIASSSDTNLITPAFGMKSNYYKTLAISDHERKPTDLWRDVVSEYTHRKLTYEEDVFPALAGLAKQMEPFRKCSYYAGLWEDSLTTDLLWAAVDRDSLPIGYQYPRPAKWRAPSWSWAATTAPVAWTHIGCDIKGVSSSSIDLVERTFVSEVKAECIQQVGHDSTMRLKSGIISMNGHMFPAPASSIEDHRLQVDESAVRAEGRVWFMEDYNISDQHGSPVLSIKELRCVLVGEVPNITYYSIVLRPIYAKDAVYERVGLLRHKYRLDDGESRTTFTVI